MCFNKKNSTDEKIFQKKKRRILKNQVCKLEIVFNLNTEKKEFDKDILNVETLI